MGGLAGLQGCLVVQLDGVNGVEGVPRGTGWGAQGDGDGGVREGVGNPLRRAGTRANPHTRASVLRVPDLPGKPGFPIFRGSQGDPPSVFRVSQGCQGRPEIGGFW